MTIKKNEQPARSQDTVPPDAERAEDAWPKVEEVMRRLVTSPPKPHARKQQDEPPPRRKIDL